MREPRETRPLTAGPCGRGGRQLRHLGLDAHANNIAAATYGVIEAGKVRLPLSLILSPALLTPSPWHSSLTTRTAPPPARTQIRTPDMGGKNSTTDFTQAVMKALK